MIYLFPRLRIFFFVDYARDEYLLVIEAREDAENQVQFLNSVIVDMQRKNETLLERVQYLENIIPSDLLWVPDVQSFIILGFLYSSSQNIFYSFADLA